MSGTSMAAGLVSGAAALMLAQDSSLSPATIKARLMRSARKIRGDPVATGAGVMDVTAALADTGVMKGDALSPRLVPAALWNDVSFSASAIWDGANDWTSTKDSSAPQDYLNAGEQV
jgi:subtilisin family serine protease